jgi:NAD(P)-dependent dehydrogenase (short-subunit alcohol dehydrogenase family)
MPEWVGNARAIVKFRQGFFLNEVFSRIQRTASPQGVHGTAAASLGCSFDLGTSGSPTSTGLRLNRPLRSAQKWPVRQSERSRQEVTPQGIRVMRVSPGWVETEAAVALAERLAAQAGTDYEGGKQIIMKRSITYSLTGQIPHRAATRTRFESPQEECGCSLRFRLHEALSMSAL